MKQYIREVATWFDSLPSWLKVIVYSSLSVFLGVITSDINGESSFDWREYAVILPTLFYNVVAYLLVKANSDAE